jgi:hypothetical protein
VNYEFKPAAPISPFLIQNRGGFDAAKIFSLRWHGVIIYHVVVFGNALMRAFLSTVVPPLSFPGNVRLIGQSTGVSSFKTRETTGLSIEKKKGKNYASFSIRRRCRAR